MVRSVKLRDASNITNPLAFLVYFWKIRKKLHGRCFFVALLFFLEFFFPAFASEISFFVPIFWNLTTRSKLCFKFCCLKNCQTFALNILLFSPPQSFQFFFEFKYCCFSLKFWQIFSKYMDWCFKIQGFSLYGNLYYWDIARIFPVQKSCAAFFDGTDSCLFTFSNGTKTCLFVFAGALKRPIGKNKKKFQFHSKK